VFPGVFIAEEIYGLGDKDSRYITTVDVKTLLKVFLNMSSRSACFNNEAFFLVKSKTSGLRANLLECHVISRELDAGLKEFFCNSINYTVYEPKCLQCQMILAKTPFTH